MKSALIKLALMIALTAAPVPGQGCVQCATSAHGAGRQGENALLKGMFVLLLPSITILSGISVLVYRNRRA
jgi:hypothetical protein